MAFACLGIILIYSVCFIDGFERQNKPDSNLVEARGRLLANLLKNYDKRVIPQNDTNSPVTIAIEPVLYTLKLENYDTPPVGLHDYLGNKEWEITSTSADIRKETYPCCPDKPHYSIWFSLKLKRNSVYYTYVFILPALILALLVPFQFVLPPDSKERLTFGSVLLFGIVILITMIQDFLPRAHTTIPYLVQYYCLTMVWIGLSMIFSIWVINIQNQALRKLKVPGFVRKIFLGPLKKVVCVNNYYYDTLYDAEPVSLREIKSKVEASEMSTSGGDKTEKSDKEILLDEYRLLLRNLLAADSRAHATSEWYQVALVVDRIMCFLFCLVFIIYSCALLS